MKIENTTKLPIAVFYIPADPDTDRSNIVLSAGESTEIDLQPGDSVKTRIATEITDPVEQLPAEDEAKEA